MMRYSRFVIRAGMLGLIGLSLSWPGWAAVPDGPAWWKNRPLRIYHPNMREVEADALDVRRLIADCETLHAEAVVFSTGGMVAFYDTQVPHHVKSPYLKGRDLLQEVIDEATAHHIRVIARLDFGKARQELFATHPDWFHLGSDGRPIPRSGGSRDRFYETTPLGGYQQDDFAIPVLRELFSRYALGGVHLNGPGFSTAAFGAATIQKYHIPTDPQVQRRWRGQHVADQMRSYRDLMHRDHPDALFMAEIDSPENSERGARRGFDHELLAQGYTNLLSTVGDPNDDKLYRFRWWPALTADVNTALRASSSGLPIINLKVGLDRGKLALKPVDEYVFHAYQAVAHNAGIKAATYGLMANMPDPRAASMIGNVFRFMEEHAPHLTDAEPIAPVALLWPREDAMDAEGSLRNELLGLYRAMVSRHILFEIVPAHRLPGDLARRTRVVVLPSAAMLDAPRIETLMAFVKAGGRLVFIDGEPGQPIPSPLARFLGGEWSDKPLKSAYAIPAQAGFPGPLALSGALRAVIPPADVRVWYTSSSTPQGSFSPEAMPFLETGDRPIVFSRTIGQGQVVYCAGGLGSMMWRDDLPDYRAILDRMIYPEASEPRTLETDAPDTVSVTAFRTPSGTSIHLVNGTGAIPLDRVVPVGPIHLRLAGRQARRAMWYTPDQPPVALDLRSGSGATEVVIPSLHAYGLMVGVTE